MKNITIVDDAFDLGRMLQAMLLTMDSTLSISVVPSAEEAILDSGRRPVTLLITDIRLPGISGLELVRRIRLRNPEIKVILISGTSDDNVIQKANELHTDGFFHKPLDFTEFLDCSRICLGLPPKTGNLLAPADTLAAEPEQAAAVPAAAAEPEQAAQAAALDQSAEAAPAAAPETVSPTAEQASVHPLTDRLVELRQRLGAQAVLVLDEVGRTIVQAGDWPEVGVESGLIPALFGSLSASERVSHLLGEGGQRLVQGYFGTIFDLALAPLGVFALVAVQKKGRSALRLALTLEELLASQEELTKALAELAEPPAAAPASAALLEPASSPAEGISEPEPVEELGLEGLMSLLDQPAGHPRPEDAESFWKDQKGSSTLPESPNILSYDEAARLGLTPPAAQMHEKNQ